MISFATKIGRKLKSYDLRLTRLELRYFSFMDTSVQAIEQKFFLRSFFEIFGNADEALKKFSILKEVEEEKLMNN